MVKNAARERVTSSKISSESVSLLLRFTGMDRCCLEFREMDLPSLSDGTSVASRTVVRDKPLSTRESPLVQLKQSIKRKRREKKKKKKSRQYDDRMQDKPFRVLVRLAALVGAAADAADTLFCSG